MSAGVPPGQRSAAAAATRVGQGLLRRCGRARAPRPGIRSAAGRARSRRGLERRQAVGQRLRVVGEEPRHLGGRLEVALGIGLGRIAQRVDGGARAGWRSARRRGGGGRGGGSGHRRWRAAGAPVAAAMPGQGIEPRAGRRPGRCRRRPRGAAGRAGRAAPRRPGAAGPPRRHRPARAGSPPAPSPRRRRAGPRG